MVGRKSLRMVDELDEAAQEYAFIGAAHPGDMGGIELRHVRAKQALLDHIRQLENTIKELKKK